MRNSEKCDFGVAGLHRVNPPARERLPQHEPVGGIVVDNQHMQPVDLARSGDRYRLPVPDLKSGDELKTASLALLALRPDAAAHHAHDALGNGKAQPCAAMLARDGGVGLRERIEDGVNLIGGNTRTRIADAKMQSGRFAFLHVEGHLQRNFAGFRKLDRVADQIHQNLLQALRIAYQLAGHVGVNRVRR